MFGEIYVYIAQTAYDFQDVCSVSEHDVIFKRAVLLSSDFKLSGFYIGLYGIKHLRQRRIYLYTSGLGFYRRVSRKFPLKLYISQRTAYVSSLALYIRSFDISAFRLSRQAVTRNIFEICIAELLTQIDAARGYTP